MASAAAEATENASANVGDPNATNPKGTDCAGRLGSKRNSAFADGSGKGTRGVDTCCCCRCCAAIIEAVAEADENASAIVGDRYGMGSGSKSDSMCIGGSGDAIEDAFDRSELPATAASTE